MLQESINTFFKYCFNLLEDLWQNKSDINIKILERHSLDKKYFSNCLFRIFF